MEFMEKFKKVVSRVYVLSDTTVETMPQQGKWIKIAREDSVLRKCYSSYNTQFKIAFQNENAIFVFSDSKTLF